MLRTLCWGKEKCKTFNLASSGNSSACLCLLMCQGIPTAEFPKPDVNAGFQVVDLQVIIQIYVFFRNIFPTLLFGRVADCLLLLQIAFMVFCFSCSVIPGSFSHLAQERWELCLKQSVTNMQITSSRLGCEFPFLKKAISFQTGAFVLSLKETGASCRMQIRRKVFNIPLSDGLYLGFNFRSLSSTGYLISHLSYESYFTLQLLMPLKAPANSLPSVLNWNHLVSLDVRQNHLIRKYEQ